MSEVILYQGPAYAQPESQHLLYSGIPVALPHTEEWHSARLTGFGASESAAVCGMSRWSTPYEVYCRKLGLLPDIDDNDAMWWGRAVERQIGEKFCLDTGRRIIQYPMPVLRHEEHPFMLATPDFLLDEQQLLETKSKLGFGRDEWGDEDTDEIPTAYVFQTQQQMAVTGLEVCHVAALMPGPKLRRYRIERNEALIEQIVKREAELWERIQNQDPPEPDWHHPTTLQLMKDLHNQCNDEALILPASFAQIRRERDEIAKQIKVLQQEVDAKDAMLLDAIGEHDRVIFEADAEGYPCEFELSRTWIEPTHVSYDRKGYYMVRKTKVK